MTEELKEKAEKYANHNDWFEFSANVDKIGNVIRTKMERAYIAGATEETKELQAQIEKMKNWCNCKNYQQCLIELAEQGKGMKPSECCVNCKKWEIKENESKISFC